jgi:hypothetical protein
MQSMREGWIRIGGFEQPALWVLLDMLDSTNKDNNTSGDGRQTSRADPVRPLLCSL